MNKWIKKVGISLLLVTALLLAAGFYMLRVSLQPEPSSRDLETSYRYMFDTYPRLEAWVDSLRHEGALRDTTIVAEDGAKLHALYVHAAQPTQATAVIIHGYTDNAIRMLMIGQMYHEDLGYNILLPDLRNSGQSDGDHYQMGWHDRWDALRWMQVANELFGGDTEMVVHGISMGAATTMMVSGEEQEPYVRCFVEDCGYTDVWEEFEHKLNQLYGLPSFPLMHITDMLCRLRYGWGFREASALSQVRKCTLPMLFIHGDSDDYVPSPMVHPLYEAKAGAKELWVVPGATHAMSYRDHPEEYTERVRAFVGKYIRANRVEAPALAS